jgi:hypothetical protein
MDQYKFFLQDLVVLLKEKLEQAKEKQAIGDVFEKGISLGIYESLDLIKQQAKAFEIPLDEIGLENYILEKYL